jgi:hypothetical protein
MDYGTDISAVYERARRVGHDALDRGIAASVVAEGLLHAVRNVLPDHAAFVKALRDIEAHYNAGAHTNAHPHGT